MAIIKLPLFIFTAVSFASCTIHANIPQDYEIPSYKTAEKIHLKMGLFLNPDINKINIYSTPRQGLIVHIGNSLSRNAEKMTKDIFNEVIVFSGNALKEPIGPKKVDAIITPEVTSVNLHILQKSFSQVLDCMIIIKWTIVDRNGKLLYVNTFTGEARYEPYRPFGGENRARECVINAIDDHFRKAYQAIANTKWWHDIKQ